MSDVGRILFVMPTVQTGGMEAHTIEAAREFVRRGLKVAAIIPEDCRPLEVSFLGAGAQVKRLTIDARHGRLAQLRDWPKLVGAMRSWHPDVVHVQTGGPSGGFSLVAAARLAGIRPIVVTEHEVPDETLPPRQVALRRWMDSMSDALIAVSNRNASLRALNLGAPPRRFAVVLNGVPIPEITSEEQNANRATVRKLCSIEPDTVVIGCLVRLVEGKGLHDLLRAFATLRNGWPNVNPAELLLVGDGPLRDELVALAHGLNVAEHVRFVGHQAEPAPFLDAMDLFVLAVPQGSMSIALLEAMGRGVCSIITFPGPEEPVINGLTGLTALPNDPLNLARVMRGAVLNPDLRARLGAAGAAHVRRYFSVERVADDLLAIYRAASAGNVPTTLRFQPA